MKKCFILLSSLIFLLALSLSASAQTILNVWGDEYNLSGSNASFSDVTTDDFHGGVVSLSHGDFNNDNYSDMLVGVAWANGGNGSVYIIFGGAVDWGSRDFNLSVANVTYMGDNSSNFLGFSVAGIGDLNGDNFDDFVMAAPGNDFGGSNFGKVYLVLGGSNMGGTNILASNASNASFVGTAGLQDDLRVADAGDVNNDTFKDFLIGEFENSGSGSQGEVYLFLGASNFNLTQNQNFNLSNASWIGDANSDNFGTGLSKAGDVNNDGYDDFLVGADNNDDGGTNAGKAYLFLGGANLNLTQDQNATEFANATFIGEIANDNAGTVAPAGDINNDGFDDFLIGSPRSDALGLFDLGEVYLWLGASNIIQNKGTNLSLSNASYIGSVQGDSIGDIGQVYTAGDVNNDSYSDFLIGSPLNSDTGASNGQVYLISGASTVNLTLSQQINVSNVSILNDSFVAEVVGDQAGIVLHDAGDFDNDGFADFQIVAAQEFAMGDNVYLLFGAEPAIADSDAGAPYFQINKSGSSRGHNSDEREAAGLEAIKNQYKKETPEECRPIYKCSSWSKCSNGKQSKVCYDKMNCGKDLEISRECSVKELARVVEKKVLEDTVAEEKYNKFPAGLFLMLVILISILGYDYVKKNQIRNSLDKFINRR